MSDNHSDRGPYKYSLRSRPPVLLLIYYLLTKRLDKYSARDYVDVLYVCMQRRFRFTVSLVIIQPLVVAMNRI